MILFWNMVQSMLKISVLFLLLLWLNPTRIYENKGVGQAVYSQWDTLPSIITTTCSPTPQTFLTCASSKLVAATSLHNWKKRAIFTPYHQKYIRSALVQSNLRWLLLARLIESHPWRNQSLLIGWRYWKSIWSAENLRLEISFQSFRGSLGTQKMKISNINYFSLFTCFIQSIYKKKYVE